MNTLNENAKNKIPQAHSPRNRENEPHVVLTVLGQLCRFAVVHTGVFGMCVLLANSFDFSLWFSNFELFFITLIPTAIFFTVTVLSRLTSWAKWPCTAAAVGMFILLSLYLSATGVGPNFLRPAWNRAIQTLVEHGYSSLNALMLQGFTYGADRGFVFIAWVISLLYTLSLSPRARLIPTALTVTTVVFFPFIYNLVSENFGFALLVSSCFGAGAFAVYEGFFKGKRSKGKKAKTKGQKYGRGAISFSAGGGMAGFLVLVFIFTLAAYPASLETEPPGEITEISKIVDRIRYRIFPIISGEGDGGGLLSVYSTSRSTLPGPREYENVTVMYIHAENPNRRIYLKGWTGGSYDSITSRWNTVSTYEDLTHGASENVTELYTYLVSGLHDACLYGDFRQTVQVEIRNMRTDLIYMPQRTFCYCHSPGYMPEYMALSYAVADGVRQAYSPLEQGNKYVFESFTPHYGGNFAKELDEDREMYELCTYMLFEEGWGDVNIAVNTLPNNFGYTLYDAVESAVRDNAAAFDVSEADISAVASTVCDVYVSKSRTELTEWYENVRDYRDFVYSAYTDDAPEQYIIRAVTEALGKEPASGERLSAENTLDTVKALCLWMWENTEYSVDPTGYNVFTDPIEQFLFTAQNGYCVQYATALALMCRSLGIPARYVEGFTASGFKSIYGPGSFRASTPVKDSDAHAWVEVYIENYGWITVEATKAYAGELIDIPDSTDTDEESRDTDAPDTGEDTAPGSDTNETLPPASTTDSTGVGATEPPSDTDGPITSPGKTGKITPFIIIAASAAAVFTAVYAVLVRKKAKKARKERLENAVRGIYPKNKKALAKEISEYILYALKQAGVTREKTETLNDLTKKAREKMPYINFDSFERAMQGLLYGPGPKDEDISDLAGCALEISEKLPSKMKGIKRFIHVTLLGRI